LNRWYVEICILEQNIELALRNAESCLKRFESPHYQNKDFWLQKYYECMERVYKFEEQLKIYQA